jgi:hypothetical protein
MHPCCSGWQFVTLHRATPETTSLLEYTWPPVPRASGGVLGPQCISPAVFDCVGHVPLGSRDSVKRGDILAMSLGVGAMPRPRCLRSRSTSTRR